MRINVYSQELILDPEQRQLEAVVQRGRESKVFMAVRMFLHSSDALHDMPGDDDRSAVTFWLPKSAANRERLALQFEAMARMVRAMPNAGGDARPVDYDFCDGVED